MVASIKKKNQVKGDWPPQLDKNMRITNLLMLMFDKYDSTICYIESLLVTTCTTRGIWAHFSLYFFWVSSSIALIFREQRILFWVYNYRRSYVEKNGNAMSVIMWFATIFLFQNHDRNLSMVSPPGQITILSKSSLDSLCKLRIEIDFINMNVEADDPIYLNWSWNKLVCIYIQTIYLSVLKYF